jgi:hypothetical protein
MQDTPGLPHANSQIDLPQARSQRDHHSVTLQKDQGVLEGGSSAHKAASPQRPMSAKEAGQGRRCRQLPLSPKGSSLCKEYQPQERSAAEIRSAHGCSENASHEAHQLGCAILHLAVGACCFFSSMCLLLDESTTVIRSRSKCRHVAWTCHVYFSLEMVSEHE